MEVGEEDDDRVVTCSGIGELNFPTTAMENCFLTRVVI